VPPGLALERLLDVRFDPPWPDERSSLRAAEAAVEYARSEDLRRSAALPSRGPLRIVHYIGDLGPGGAERQLTYLAGGSADAGHEVSVVTKLPLSGEEAHYAPALRRRGIPCRSLAPRWHNRFPPLYRGSLENLLPGDLGRTLEQHVSSRNLVPLVKALLRDPPHVLHCWLDEPNTSGALAGLAAGVPRIVVGTRSVNPSHFPHLHRSYFRGTYGALARDPRVVFMANSHAGARDYAAWCGVSPERFAVVHNGFDAASCLPLSESRRRSARRALGVDPDSFLVVGMFRLAPVKRPFDFLAVVDEARRRIPRLRALHLGVGPQEAQVRRKAEEMGLAPVLRFLGRRRDPWTCLGAADACLLTSELEGCPNVALESQALEVPVVLTAAGGSRETLEDDRTGYVCEVGDTATLCRRLCERAGEPALRQEMGRRGRALVQERFSMRTMIDRQLELYRPQAKPEA
jgi:glycosyltransferase involved in cell wall biosynthesis